MTDDTKMQGPFQDIAFTDDGAELRFWSQGSGRKTLCLVSGLGGSGGFWKDVAPALAEHVRVISFDQRGIGGSTRGISAVTIECLARDCLSVMDAAGDEDCLLLGHSTGGCIVQACARLAPERVKGLVLSAAWMSKSRYMAALFKTRREILSMDPVAYAKSAALLSYPPDWLEQNWHVFDAAMANAPVDAWASKIVGERIDALLSFDGPPDKRVLALPALVLGSRDDMIVPFFLQEELGLAFPNARMTMFDSGGHFFPLSRRDAFIEEVSKWIAEQ